MASSRKKRKIEQETFGKASQVVIPEMPLEKIGADYERGFMDVVCGVGKAAEKGKK